MASITIERRFCGPPSSANGGYCSGLIAAAAGASVAVRLLKPPPLDVPLEVLERGAGIVEVRHRDELIAQTRPNRIPAPTVKAPAYVEAVRASQRYVGFDHHPFPSCFVCGPRRERGDGLRIFPGTLGDTDAVAAPWVPDDSLAAADGKVGPEFMWAALDCPGWLAALKDARVALLGELTVHIDRRVRVGDRCLVLGWRAGGSGRKHEAGTALYDEDGVLCGYASAIWVEPRS